MRITGCDIWPLQCPTCNPSTMHGVLLGWDHFKGGIIFKSPYWHPTYTSIYSFNNNRGPGNAASDVLTSADGEGDEVRTGRWKEEVGGVCCCATRRKFPSLRPSKQRFSPETKAATVHTYKQRDVDINGSTEREDGWRVRLSFYYRSSKRPFVISMQYCLLCCSPRRMQRKWRFIVLIFHTLWPCQWVIFWQLH